MKQKRVLYISYDGMLEALGQSQVLNYLFGLAEKGWNVHLISFEKKEDWDRQTLRGPIAQQISAAGISWHPLRYHKRFSFLATLFDVMVGGGFALYFCWRYRFALVHARSYVAALIALLPVHLFRTRFLFDMRGLWADEKADEGSWSRKSLIYKFVKVCERKFFGCADKVVTLTEAVVTDIKTFPYMVGRDFSYVVIPTCADTNRFKPPKQKLASDNLVLGYVGSVRGWHRFDKVLEFFARLLRVRNEARLLVLNRGDHEFIHKLYTDLELPVEAFEVREVLFNEIQDQIGQIDVGIDFGKADLPGNSGRVPTRFGELLSCGVPCIYNRGIGDIEAIIERYSVGALVDEFNSDSYDRGIDSILATLARPGIGQECREVALRYFSLTKGITKYDETYTELAAMGKRI